jgi:hypothetical protein
MRRVKIDEQSIYNDRFRVRLECVVAFFCSKVQNPYGDKEWNVTICLGSGHSVHQHMTFEEKEMVSQAIAHGNVREAPVEEAESEFGCYLDGDDL